MMNRVIKPCHCYITVLIAALTASPSAGQQILKWSGAERDSHPCLYITAKDIGRLKKTRKDLVELSKKTSWSLESDGMDKLLVGALLTDNAEAQQVVVAEAIRNLAIVIQRSDASGLMPTAGKSVSPPGWLTPRSPAGTSPHRTGPRFWRRSLGSAT
jgi:hypothetical protein